MKKTLLFAMLITTSLGWSQEKLERSSEKKEKFVIEQDTWNVSGLFSFSNTNNNTQNSSQADNLTISFSGSVGYFIKDNWSLGVRLSYTHDNKQGIQLALTPPTESTENRNIISFAPYLKKYFAISKKLGLSIQGELAYTYTEEETNNINVNTILNSTNAFAINLRPGITYFLSKNIALEGNIGVLGYEKSSTLEKPSNIETFKKYIVTSISLSNVFLGLSIYF